MSDTMMSFQLLGGTFTGSSGLTFKKKDLLTSVEPLDMMFPNKFLRVASGVATGAPCADRKVAPPKPEYAGTPPASLMDETVRAAQAQAVNKLNEQAPPEVGGLAMQPENVIEQGVPLNATDVTSQFLAQEKSLEYDLMIWRLPSGGYAASGRVSRALLNEKTLKNRPEVQAFIGSRTGG